MITAKNTERSVNDSLNGSLRSPASSTSPSLGEQGAWNREQGNRCGSGEARIHRHYCYPRDLEPVVALHWRASAMDGRSAAMNIGGDSR